MTSKKSRLARSLMLPLVLVAAVAMTLAAASCGGGTEAPRTSGTTTKMPPGESDASYAQADSDAQATQTQAASDDGEEEGSTTTDSIATTTSVDPAKTAYLSGADFSVVSVTREDSNDIVAGSNVREVSGDFLLVEMTVENTADELVDLSSFSFRLWNPAIDAGLYEDFYGSDGTYGGYVSENMISATLLDYETLQPVSIKLRAGETVDNVFLFFDLNPQSTAVNDGVSLDGTNLVIYDSDSGDKVEINLADYAA